MNALLIYDVGCHTGQDSDFYLKKGFRVVAVEANPDLCAGLKDRFRSYICDGRFTLVEKAISDRDDAVTFFVCHNKSVWGTTSPDFAERNAACGSSWTKITVPATTFSSLIRQYGMPYYLKIDIEGCDKICLEHLMQFEDRPIFISTEVEGPFLLNGTIRALRRLGYSKFHVIDQGAVPSQIPPSPSREGCYVSHRFEWDASGLFGRELPEGWTSSRGVALRYYANLVGGQLKKRWKAPPVIRNKMLPDGGHWYDIHATV